MLLSEFVSIVYVKCFGGFILLVLISLGTRISFSKEISFMFFHFGVDGNNFFNRISIFKAPQALINILMFTFEDFRELSLNGTLGSTGPFRP